MTVGWQEPAPFPDALLVLRVAAAFGLDAAVEAPARRWIRARIGQTPQPGSKRSVLARCEPPDL